jgi:hypothetical protein
MSTRIKKMDEVTAAIKALELVSELLMKAANKPELYNTDFAYYIEKVSNKLNKDVVEMNARKEFWSYLERIAS